MMKYLSLLLSVVIIYAICNPCCGDEAECTELSSVHENGDSKESEQHDSVPCSPFFSCGNCSGFVFNNADQSLTGETFDFREQISFALIITCENSGFYSNLEKPPQRRI